VHKLSTWARCVHIPRVRGIKPCDVEEQEQQRHRQLGHELTFGEDGYELVLPNDQNDDDDGEGVKMKRRRMTMMMIVIVMSSMTIT